MILIKFFGNDAVPTNNTMVRNFDIFTNFDIHSDPNMISNDDVFARIQSLTFSVNNGMRIRRSKINIMGKHTILSDNYFRAFASSQLVVPFHCGIVSDNNLVAVILKPESHACEPDAISNDNFVVSAFKYERTRL